MALRRQIRVGSQWMYADEAHKALREALRVMEDEKLAEAHGGHHLPWIRRYVFSTDHKWIGLQYGFTALLFLLLGFCLMILMRLQLGWPGQAFSVMKLLGESRAPGGVLLPEAYNPLGASHGPFITFLGTGPLAAAPFRNYFSRLRICAPDTA